MEKNISLGCHDHSSCEKNIGFADPYARTLSNVMKGSLSIPGFNGTLVYRSFSPEHFQSGSWDTGGQCNHTTPGGVPMPDLTRLMYDVQKATFKNVTGQHHDNLLEWKISLFLVFATADFPLRWKNLQCQKSRAVHNIIFIILLFSCTEELGVVAKERLKLLGITDLAQVRADGHPNNYREEHKNKAKKLPSDCLHWCLPGPIDTWNDLLVQSLHNVIFQ